MLARTFPPSLPTSKGHVRLLSGFLSPRLGAKAHLLSIKGSTGRQFILLYFDVSLNLSYVRGLLRYISLYIRPGQRQNDMFPYHTETEIESRLL